MVKRLDEIEVPVIDHIGVDLWRAALAWRDRLHSEMVARGHDWYGDARGAVVAHLDPAGLAQSELVARMGMTKQAVQQLLDGLERDGVVRRSVDAGDRRSKRVVYTAKGRAALRDANAIKRELERGLEVQLGGRVVERLRTTLRDAAGALKPSGASGPGTSRTGRRTPGGR